LISSVQSCLISTRLLNFLILVPQTWIHPPINGSFQCLRRVSHSRPAIHRTLVSSVLDFGFTRFLLSRKGTTSAH
jgi:hypothetical protein